MKNKKIFSTVIIILSFAVNLSAKIDMTIKELDTVMELVAGRNVSFEQKLAIEKALKASLDSYIPSTPLKRKASEEVDVSSPLPRSRGNRDLGKGCKLFCSPAQAAGDTFLPKSHDHFVVYAHMLTPGKDPLIRRNSRINFTRLLGKDSKKKEIPITEKNLNQALLAIENRIRYWIHNNPNIYYHTTYIGLAEDFGHRASGHGSSFSSALKKFELAKCRLPALMDEGELEEEGISYDYKNVTPLSVGRKVRFSMLAKDLLGYNIRMSPLVHDIPKKWLPLVEVLVGSLFNSTYKAGTLLGNEEAIERYDEYMKSDVRRVGSIPYFGEIERMHQHVVETLLGMHR